VICYLGSIGEKRAHLVRPRIDFWELATKKLNALDLSEEERTPIELRLAELVRPVVGEELAEYDKHMEEFSKVLKILAHRWPGQRKKM